VRSAHRNLALAARRCQPLDTLAGLLVSLQQGSAEPFQLSTSSYPSRLIRNEGLPENMTPYEGRAAFRADEFIADPSLHLVFRNWLLHCAIASIARISDGQCQPLSSVRRLASSQRGAVSFVSINASRRFVCQFSPNTMSQPPPSPTAHRALQFPTPPIAPDRRPSCCIRPRFRRCREKVVPLRLSLVQDRPAVHEALVHGLS
jgi:hypothetical protein